MEAIRTYLDNVFAAFEQTPRLLALKAEMQAGMEEKYHALKQEGKSEHEAVGNVIADFGSMDEITAELGLAREESVPVPQNGLTVSREEAFEYVRLMKKSGRWIGFGVWLILAGVAALVTINGFIGAYGIGVFVLLSFVTAAVTMFIVNGTRMSRYEEYKESQIILDSQTRADLKQQQARFMSRFAFRIAGGVAMILLAVGLQVLFSDLVLFSVNFMSLTDISFAPVFLLIVGFAVFMFVNASYQKSTYDILLGEGEYKHAATEKGKKADRIIGTVAVVFWPVITATFLLWGFVWDAWHISWVIWPVAGILFGAFAGGMGVWYDE